MDFFYGITLAMLIAGIVFEICYFTKDRLQYIVIEFILIIVFLITFLIEKGILS